MAHLYWHFLVYQHHLDESAAEYERQKKDGQWLRSYLQKQLGFTDGEFAPVRASAERLSARISELDAKAKGIVAADRSVWTHGLMPASGPPPSLEKLKALTAEREVAISAEIENLNQALTPQRAAALRAFLNEKFSQNVTTLPINRTRQPIDRNRQATGSFASGGVQRSVQP